MDETRLAELQYFRPGIDAHHLSFTGSGSQYMRVWLINLLLTVLTLGVYWPYARRWSRLRPLVQLMPYWLRSLNGSPGS